VTGVVGRRRDVDLDIAGELREDRRRRSSDQRCGRQSDRDRLLATADHEHGLGGVVDHGDRLAGLECGLTCRCVRLEQCVVGAGAQGGAIGMDADVDGFGEQLEVFGIGVGAGDIGEHQGPLDRRPHRVGHQHARRCEAHVVLVADVVATIDDRDQRSDQQDQAPDESNGPNETHTSVSVTGSQR
jgi:hypothetical protein